MLQIDKVNSRHLLPNSAGAQKKPMLSVKSQGDFGAFHLGKKKTVDFSPGAGVSTVFFRYSVFSLTRYV